MGIIRKKKIYAFLLGVFFVCIISFFYLTSTHQNQAQAASATFYPNYSPESTSVDGYAERHPTTEPFATIRSGVGTTADHTGATSTAIGLYAGNTNQYSVLRRGYFLFDTSSLPSDAVIDSATLSLYVTAKANSLVNTDANAAMALVSGIPASNTAIVSADYALANFGLPANRFATDILYSSITTSAYNPFTLNATGLAAIGKGVGGMSKFGLMLAVDLDNGSPHWVNLGNTTYTMRMADYGDHTTYAPKLIVTYHIDPPAQVTGLHHTGNTTSTISWDWDDAADATGYRVYRASDNALLADNLAVSNWDQGSLSPNVQSTVYVKAYNAGGEGTASANASAYTSANPPSGASHSGNTTTGITWTWQVNSNPAGTQFYASDSTGNSGWSADAVSWNASSGHSANTHYTVSAKARNGDNEETSAVTASAYTSIENPTGATWGIVGTDSIALSGQGTISNLSSGSSGIYFRESVTGTNSGWLTTNTWTRNSLSPNTVYHFYITTRNGDGEANSEQGPYDKYTLVGQVTGASALSGWDSNPAIGNYVIVSWNILSATSVRIRCLNTGTDVYTGAWSPYVHSLLSANTLYTYRIYSINGEGQENPAYVEVSATTPPAGSINLHHTANTISSIAWDWDDVTGATGYKVYRASDNVQLDDVASSDWLQGSLSINTQYFIYIRAYNIGGEGPASANAQAYTSANPPAGLGHSGQTLTGITWIWNTNSNPLGTNFYASDSTGNSGWSADGTSWNASSGHSANTQYTVSVKARNGDNDETSDITAQAYTSIENVTGATWGTIGIGSIQLSGAGTISNLISGSSGIIFRESVTATDSTWLQTNTWTRNLLSPNTAYHFYITTRNGDGEANTEQGPYDKYTLAAPVSSASASAFWDSNPAIGNYIIISWNILSATSVRIRCLNTGTDVYTGAWSPYVHANLLANTEYTYRIYSINGEGVENPAYVEVSATTPPAQPQNLILIGLTANTATVTWNQVVDATGYILSLGTDTNAENIGEITVSGQTNTTYTFQNLEPGTRYYVKVRADNGSLGAWSNIINFQTQSAPSSPSWLINAGVKIFLILLLSAIIFTTALFTLNKFKLRIKQ